MKNIQIQPGTNWVSLEPEYKHDRLLKLHNINSRTSDGITLTINTTLTSTVDEKVNNYSKLILTDTNKLSDLAKIDLDQKKFPQQYTTYIMLNGFPTKSGATKYLKVIPEVSDALERQYTTGDTTIDGVYHSSWYNGQDIDDNSIYCELILHDQNNASILHNDNYAQVYLTTVGEPSNNLTFTLSGTPDNIPNNNQKFQYIIDTTSGRLILYKVFQDGTYYITSTNNTLTARKMRSNDTTYPLDSVITIIPQSKTSSALKLTNNWVSYKTGGDQNNLNINFNKSYSDVTNNYLLNTQYIQISGDKLPVNITPLKNQLTPEYNQSRNNPFPNYVPCDHREYDMIFSGTNQRRGSDKLYLGYNSYTTDIELQPDSITYFHTPQDMYPYKRINVNDSGLIESGAIGGDSPIVADKIFKKSADYKHNTPYGAPTSEETGNWLCSWLKTNVSTQWDDTTKYNKNIIVNFKDKIYRANINNTNTKPGTDLNTWSEDTTINPTCWVDRYYNPKHYSATEALKVENQYNEYSSKFEYIVETLGAEKEYVFDKVSDLTFEPGCLYAYYRVGPKENKVTTDNLKYHLVHEGIEPTLNLDGSQYINTADELSLDGTKYIQTTPLSYTKNSDITISFWLNSDNWNAPIGSQIIGNYTNNGIGIFNKENITPYIIIPAVSSTEIYNTDLEHQLSIPVSGTPVHLDGNENIHIITNTSSGRYILQYDVKGLLLEKTELSEVYNDIQSACVNYEDIYLQDINNNIFKYNIDSERYDQLYRSNPGAVVGKDTIPNINSAKTYINLHDDYQYRINCDTYSMDLSGAIWFSKNKNIYKYSPSPRRGSNATYTNTLPTGEYISLVSEHVGFEGNNISITGDGQTTLSTLTQNWNGQYTDNKVQIITGHNSKPALTISLSGGAPPGTPVTLDGMKTVDNISSIKCDYNNNVWILIDSNDNTTSKIFKLNTDRTILYSNTLSAIDTTLSTVSGNSYMDMITEFNSTGYQSYIIILKQKIYNNIPQGDIDVIKLDLDGKLISKKSLNIPHLEGLDVNTLYNITNYESIKQLHKDTINKNHITLKLRYQSYFDTDKTYVTHLKYDVTNLTHGYHSFGMAFNSIDSNISLYVDGILVDNATSNDPYTGAAYKYTTTIHNPLTIGTVPYFNNATLSEAINQPTHHKTFGVKLANVRIYNSYLNHYKIKTLSRERRSIQPIKLTLPTGKRSYIDHITKIYKHRTPGRKAEKINIDIISKTLSGNSIKTALESELREEINRYLPANANINTINWIT